MRKLLPAAILATLVSSDLAIASPYSDFYVFGDSLFDSGNLGNDFRFTNRVGPDYQNSAYGPVSPMIIAEALGRSADPSEQGGSNYAVGGNLTADVLESITAARTYEAPAGTFNSFSYDLNRQGRELDTKALYYLGGGGNDIPQFVPAEVMASNLVDAANALQDRGAKYVLLANVPDFGSAPAGVLLESFVRPIILEANAQILEKVGSSNIFIINTYDAIQEFVADPMAYGIGVSKEEVSFASFDATCPTCTQGDPEAKIDGSNPDPDKFAFNDTRHPTTVVQQVVSDYVLSFVTAPGEIAMLPEMAWTICRPIGALRTR